MFTVDTLLVLHLPKDHFMSFSIMHYIDGILTIHNNAYSEEHLWTAASVHTCWCLII